MRTAETAQFELDPANEPLHVTLLELVQAVSDVTDSDVETVATVRHMLMTRSVRLSGSFRELPVRAFC